MGPPGIWGSGGLPLAGSHSLPDRSADLGVGCQTAFMTSGLRFSDSAGDLHAARSYSLISPPSTLRRRMYAIAGPVITAGTFFSPMGLLDNAPSWK